MNLSKKEKLMLLILGIVIIGFLYYQFGYTALNKKIDKISTERDEIAAKYNNVIDTINSIESQRSKVKILNGKIAEESKSFYPTISEEHVINEIDKLLKDNGLDGGMEFDVIESNPVDAMEKSKIDKGILEGSMQGIVEEYNEYYKDNSKKEDEKEVNQASGNEKNSDVKNNSTKTDKEDKKLEDSKKAETNVIKMKGKISYYGTYENLVKFTKALTEKDKKICVYGIEKMEKNDPKWVKGKLGIVIYSIPKFNDEEKNYLVWNIKNTYGKIEPFKYSKEGGTKINNAKPSSDFIVSAKSESSDLPTVMIGKTDDSLRSSYVYADGNKVENIDIEINEKDGKYYYKYKSRNGNTPINYDGIGKEFVPCGDNIVIEVLSDRRTSKNDKSGVKLNIVNNSSKPVKVRINNDDKERPRVSIEGDKQKITIEKK